MGTSDDNTVWLRFIGDGLDVRSLPIYELGDCLVALQRIIHKTYLLEKGRLTKNATLTRRERESLSLQIRERVKSSDAFALIPFVTDAAMQEYLITLVKTGIGSLARYALQSAFPDKSQPTDSARSTVQDAQGSVLAGAIYKDVAQITNHVQNIGHVDKIEIYVGDRAKPSTLAILDEEVQVYVRNLAYQEVYGARETIRGDLTRIFVKFNSIQVKLGPGRYVKVRLSDEDYNMVRYQMEADDTLIIEGRPVIRLGKDPRAFDTFESDSVALASTEFASEDPEEERPLEAEDDDDV